MQNTQEKKAKITGGKRPVFNAQSPGFIYSIVAFILWVFAATGVELPTDPASLTGEIVTSISSGGITALITLIFASLAVPVWNFVKQGGKITLTRILSSTLVWVSFGNMVFAAIALTGFVVPAGTVEAMVSSITSKDWTALLLGIFTNIVNPLIRFLKARHQANLAALASG